jgi:hypothetical protein
MTLRNSYKAWRTEISYVKQNLGFVKGKEGELGSSVSIVSGYGLDDRAIKALASVSRPALGPTQPPVQ